MLLKEIQRPINKTWNVPACVFTDTDDFKCTINLKLIHEMSEVLNCLQSFCRIFRISEHLFTL